LPERAQVCGTTFYGNWYWKFSRTIPSPFIERGVEDLVWEQSSPNFDLRSTPAAVRNSSGKGQCCATRRFDLFAVRRPIHRDQWQSDGIKCDARPEILDGYVARQCDGIAVECNVLHINADDSDPRSFRDPQRFVHYFDLTPSPIGVGCSSSESEKGDVNHRPLHDDLPVPVVAFGCAVVLSVGVWSVLRIAETGHFVLAFAQYRLALRAISACVFRAASGLQRPVPVLFVYKSIRSINPLSGEAKSIRTRELPHGRV
jgi:hypothetical protein